MQVNPICINVLHIYKYASSVLAKLHNVADIFLWTVNMMRLSFGSSACYKRRVRIICRVVNHLNSAVCFGYSVNYARCGCNKVKLIFTLKSFLNNLHMKKSEKSAAIAKSESNRGFRLKGERRIVEL